MATYVRSIRRGLPRWPGGEPWPPAGDAPVEVGTQADVELVAMATHNADSDAPEHPRQLSADAAMSALALTPETPTGTSEMEPAVAGGTAAPAGGMWPIRRGLPRVPGGEPWPPAGAAVPAVTSVAVKTTSTPAAGPNTTAPVQAGATTPVGPVKAAPAAPTVGASDRPLRRGLPRMKGGQPWPPAGFVSARVTAEPEGEVPTTPAEIAPAVAVSAPAPAETATEPRASRAPLEHRTTPTRSTPPTRPSAQPRPRPTPVHAPESGRFGAYTRGELLGLAIIGGFALFFAGMIAVVSAAWIVNLPFTQDFLTAFPGEYHLPESATPGFPAWVQWQHFFNVFLMVLIIRSGLQVRTEKKPTAYWTPRWSKNGQGKVSLALWFHQSLDILWLLNGLIFVVMLFVTGHWMRIVPTSWEVFPNALSAALQYLSLNWPTENGWVNYNSLQQIMYFLTVFIAAPLAAITGVRMSGMWPKNAKTLSKIYPVEWARAIHFPVMLYFVAFIIIHVALVFATGALRNLNHMYGGTDVVNWAGFWIFFVSLLIIVGGWIAARPFLLAQIAKLSGKVTAR